MVFDLIFFLVLFSAVYLTGLYFFIRFILLSERDQTEAVVSLSVGGDDDKKENTEGETAAAATEKPRGASPTPKRKVIRRVKSEYNLRSRRKKDVGKEDPGKK
jgi:hypothetical protein